MAPASKKSISFFPEDLTRIESFSSNNHDSNLSGKVQEIVRDMHYALRRTQQEVSPLFTEPEWMYLRDMLNGSLVSPESIPYKTYLSFQVQEADTYDGLGAKWELDAVALTAKIQRLTEFQAYTVAKMVDAWWIEQSKENENKNLIGKTWGDLSAEKQDELLLKANCVNGITGNDAKDDGECIVDIGEYSIPGKLVNGEIIIDKDAKFYNPAE